MQHMPSKGQERERERDCGKKNERLEERQKSVTERQMLFVFGFHFHSGKMSCNKKPITVSFPCSLLKCESHEPRVQSRGGEINYLAEASRFIWPRKRPCVALTERRRSSRGSGQSAQRGRHTGESFTEAPIQSYVHFT